MSVTKLVEEIEAAWRDAQAPASSNISKPNCYDEGVAAYFTGRTWHGHTAKQLRRLSFALVVFTPEAFAYFLPAYMKADLEEPEVADIIVESLLYAFDPFDGDYTRAKAIVVRLDDRQRQVLVKYFAFIDGREMGLYGDECRRILTFLAQ